MTNEKNPDKIDRSRRNRIATGSGSDPAEINELLKQFKGMAGMMQQMAGMSVSERMSKVREMSDVTNPNAQMRAEKQRSKRGALDKNALRDKKKKERKRKKKGKKR